MCSCFHCYTHAQTHTHTHTHTHTLRTAKQEQSKEKRFEKVLRDCSAILHVFRSVDQSTVHSALHTHTHTHTHTLRKKLPNTTHTHQHNHPEGNGALHWTASTSRRTTEHGVKEQTMGG